MSSGLPSLQGSRWRRCRPGRLASLEYSRIFVGGASHALSGRGADNSKRFYGAADNRVLLDLTTSMQCSSIRRRLSFDSNG
jgi:hypothetical protein